MILIYLADLYFVIWVAVTLATYSPLRKKENQDYARIKTGHDVQLGFFDITRMLAIIMGLSFVMRWYHLPPNCGIHSTICESLLIALFLSGLIIVITGFIQMRNFSTRTLRFPASSNEVTLLRINIGCLAMFMPLLTFPLSC